MIETLLVYSALAYVGLVPKQKYSDYLDDEFLKNPDNELLFELEWHSSDIIKSINLICRHGRTADFDSASFEKMLFEKLEIIYFMKTIDINEFAKKTFAIWQILSPILPYNTDGYCFNDLNYADDFLAYGDEKTARKFYEDMFNFYRR